MATILPFRRPRQSEGEQHPPALHSRAMDNLAYIRNTMEHAGTFTAVSGWGMVVAGVLAVAASVVAAAQGTREAWLNVWLATGVSALVIQLWAMLAKARSSGISLLSGTGRKFVLVVSPPIFVGAVLTAVLYHTEAVTILPALWMLLYGAAVVAGGAFSVEIVPVMGFCFLVCGVLVLVTPSSWNDWILAGAFGGLHIAFGVPIARRYGG